MKLRSLFILTTLLVFHQWAFAQPTTFGIQNYNFALHIDTTDADPSDYERGGGAYVPDGTLIYIIRDTNNNNAQDCPTADVQPPQIPPDIIGALSYNVWPMNSNSISQDGSFDYADIGYCVSGAGQPFPSPSKFFLVVPIVNGAYAQPICWVSNVVNVNNASGLPQDFDVTSWSARVNCWVSSCTIPAPTNFVASDSLNSCNGVTMTWDYSDTNADSFFIYINRADINGGLDSLIHKRLRTSPFTYTYTAAPTGTPTPTYKIRAHRTCGGGETAQSTLVGDAGYRYVVQPRPDVTSATGLANQVRVIFNMPSINGADSVRLKRDGSTVSSALRNGTSGADTLLDNNPPAGNHNYWVVAWNAHCGEGANSDTMTAAAITIPIVPPCITASDTLCGQVNIVWCPSPGATTYIVQRDGSQIGTTSAPDTDFVDTSVPAFTIAAYRVAASNTAGTSNFTATDNGQRRAAPAQVTNVNATDSTLCSHVRITWTDVTNNTSHKIKRVTGSTGTDTVVVSSSIHADSVGYNDSTAVAGTIYNYFVQAVNSCGDGPRSSGNLGTKKARPATPTGLVATDTNCVVTITWNNVANEDSFVVYRYAQGGSITRVGSTLANTLTINDTPPTPFTNFAYRVKAFNSCGVSDSSVADSGKGEALLGQVTGVSATDTACAHVRITWTNIANEDSFQIRRNGVRIGRANRDSTNFLDATAVGDTVYTYRVVAYSACGAGDTTGTDQGRKLAPVGVVTTLTASDNGCASVTLNWTNVSGEQGYRLYRIGTGLIASKSANDTSYTDVVSAGTYTYRVVAFNPCGTDSTASDNGTVQPPVGDVTTVTASDNSCTSITLTWNNVTGEQGYRVLRDGVQIGTTGVDTVTYVDAPASGTYTYRVVAFNACGTDSSSTDTGTRLPSLAAVAGVSASDTSCANVVITWTDLNGGEQGYHIFRDATQIGDVGEAVNTFTDNVLAAGASGVYTVKAYNACGDGAESNQDTGHRRTIPGQVTGLSAGTTCSSVDLSWTALDATDGAIVYHILKDAVQVGTVNHPTVAFSFNPGDSLIHTYTVYGSNACGDGLASTGLNAARPGIPTVPTAFTATGNNCTSIALTWTSPSTADSIRIFREATQIALVPATQTNYNDAAAALGNNNYHLIAKNACGDGASTATQSATLLQSPGIPTGLVVTHEGCDGVGISWTGATGDVDSFYVFRDASFIAAVHSSVTSYFDGGASAGPSNTYTVAAKSNECGQGTQSGNLNGTRYTTPGIPVNLTASDIFCDHVSVTWGHASGSVSGYRVYREGALVQSSLDTFYVDNTNTPATISYVVVAYSIYANCDTSSASEQGHVLAVPTAATNVTASANRCDGIQVNWTAGGGAVDSNIVKRDGVTIATVAANVTSHFDGNATVGSHDYTVISYSINCEDSEESTSGNGSRLPVPGIPTSVVATEDRCQDVTITWTSGGGTVDSFRVYRDGTHIGSVLSPTTTFVDLTTLANQNYSYSVSAKDEICGESAQSTADIGLRQNGAGVPSNVVASDDSCAGVYVSWTTSTGTVDKYYIYRDGLKHDSVNAPTTTYLDLTVTPAVVYSYQISAFNAFCLETSLSTADNGQRRPVLGQVQGLTASDFACRFVELQWTAIPGTSTYKVFRNGVQIATSATNTYNDTTGTTNVTYGYSVSASNLCGDGAQSAVDSGLAKTNPANAPINVSASDTSCAGIYITFTGDDVGDISQPNTQYIYRDNVQIAFVAFNAGTQTYFDSTASAGVNHNYYVTNANACGESPHSSTDAGFRIAAAAPVTALNATDDHCADVVITWTDASNETGYVVTRDGTDIATLPAGTVTYTDTPAPGTYTYGVASVNTCGRQPAEVTSGTRTTVPVAVSLLSASQDDCDDVDLVWNDVATDTAYQVYRGATLIGSTVQNDTTFTDVNPGVGQHAYHIVAVNRCGSSADSPTVNGRVVDVPGQVASIAATRDVCNQIGITWADLSDELNYQIYRDNALLATNTQNDTDYVDSDVTPGSLHNYYVIAVNNCGSGVQSVTREGYRKTVPLQPQGVSAGDSACVAICVQWTDNDTTETSFNIYRDGEYIGEVAANVTQFCDSTAAPHSSHSYEVRAQNQCGASALSAADNGSRRAVPAQVTGLVASDNNCADVVLTWDHTAPSFYYVYRNGDVIGTPTEATYTDLNAVPGTTYSYTVAAINICSELGPVSAADNGTRRSVPAAPVLGAPVSSCNDLCLSWNNVADEDGYHIYRDAVLVGTVGVDVTTYCDATGAPGTQYSYTVKSYNLCGESAASNSQNGTRGTVPGQVTGVTATIIRCDSVIVTWTDLAGETLYRVFRGATDLGTVAANATRFADAPAPGTYSYTVRAENTCGNGTASAPATGTRITSPTAPSALTASDNLCGQIVLNWTNGTGDIDSILVKRDAAIIARLLGAPTTYTDIIAAGTHSYTVQSKSTENTCGTSGDSNADNGTSHALPTVPTALSATTNLCDTVRLTWTASTGEVEKYLIYRDTILRDSVTAPTTTYNDVTVLDYVNHSYTVTAKNTSCGQSAQSTPANGNQRALVAMVGNLPNDTLRCQDSVTVQLEHCGALAAIIDSFFFSANGGAFTFIPGGRYNPAQNTIVVQIPDIPNQLYTPNCRVRVVSRRDVRVFSDTTNAFVLECNLDADDEISDLIPKDFFLDQNYPNPFNPSTTIRFGVPKVADVTISIFDINGRVVDIVQSGTLQPGVHTVTWDCSQCGSGIYLIKLQAGDVVNMRKMMLLK